MTVLRKFKKNKLMTFERFCNVFKIPPGIVYNDIDGYNLFNGLENPLFDNEDYNSFKLEEKEKANFIIENIIHVKLFSRVSDFLCK